MSDALLPWIQSYLVSAAETYGANISNLPLYPKNKKVQLIQFLTYGSDNEDTLIWAEISDKQFIIPVKFTKEAVADYRRNRPGQRLTRHKGGIFRITGFRPISTRVPKTNGTLSTEPTLVLECTSLIDLGSSGEATFGCPESILNDPDIRLWNDGLKRDGGAGNVLKDRKEQREANKRIERVSPPPSPPPPAAENCQSEIHLDITRGKLDAYNAFWQKTAKNPLYMMKPDTSHRYLNEIIEPPPSVEYACTEVEFEDINIPSSRSATPFSTWESTPAQRQRETDETNQRRSVVVPRKVPRPASPEPMPKKHSGPALILAPNSDTSQSQSQSQSQSKQKEAGGVFRDALGIDAGDYPWLDLWRIKDIMARTVEARRLANMLNIT